MTPYLSTTSNVASVLNELQDSIATPVPSTLEVRHHESFATPVRRTESIFPIDIDSSEINSDKLVQLAAVQAQRDDELHRQRQYIRRLQQFLTEHQETNSKLRAANEELKAKLMEMDRASKRSGANLEYLKNMVVVWMEGETKDEILKVIATILQFSPQEIARIEEKRNSHQSLLNNLRVFYFTVSSIYF